MRPLKLRRHGNIFYAMATKNEICCNHKYMFQRVSALNFFGLQLFSSIFCCWNKKKSNQFDFFFVSATKILCYKWENMRKSTCPRTLSRFSEIFFLLSNQIHRKFKANQNMLSKTFYNKMVDSENVQPKQKLSDEDKQLLSAFIKRIKQSGLQK